MPPYLFPLASPSLSPSLSHPSRWSQSTELISLFPLDIYFTIGSVYMSMTLSHFVTAYPSPSPYPQVHSLIGLRLYSHLAPRFFMIIFCLFFRFHMYVYIIYVVYIYMYILCIHTQLSLIGLLKTIF